MSRLQAIKKRFTSKAETGDRSTNSCTASHIGAAKGLSKTDMILVLVNESSRSILHLKRKGDQYEPFLQNGTADGVSVADYRKMWKKSFPVICLPKSKYLTKVLHIPQVQPEEVAAVLKLEAEAQLPADYGPIEISYTPLAGSNENGYRSYWVYICQKETLDQLLADLSAYSARPQMILPSSVCWRRFFIQYPDVNAVAVPVDPGHLEIGFPDARGNPVTRIIPVRPDEARETENRIVGCIGSALGTALGDSRDFTIGWFASDRSLQTDRGHIRFLHLPDLLRPVVLDREALIQKHPALFLAAHLLLQDQLRGIAPTENLVPSELVYRDRLNRLYRKVAAGVLALLLGLVILYVSQQVSIRRYDRMGSQLNEKTAQIRQEGLYAGKQIEQIKAVHTALKTRNDFSDILLGLYEATPYDVTYSRIEFLRTGEVQLRGNCPSLSSLFLLPERLEKQPMFERVQLKDAGQTSRSGGSIAEFVITMQFIRQQK